jgi:hypothetical protein
VFSRRLGRGWWWAGGGWGAGLFLLLVMSVLERWRLCVRNDDHQESLELRKIYEVLEDASAAKHNMVRMIDEEGEDYLYPKSWFLPIELPANIEEALVELTHG